MPLKTFKRNFNLFTEELKIQGHGGDVVFVHGCRGSKTHFLMDSCFTLVVLVRGLATVAFWPRASGNAPYSVRNTGSIGRQ